MTAQQKLRILKMIEVYMDALDLDLRSALSIDGLKHSHLSVNEACPLRNFMHVYIDDLHFDEKIKEMQGYIEGVKSGTIS